MIGHRYMRTWLCLLAVAASAAWGISASAQGPERGAPGREWGERREVVPAPPGDGKDRDRKSAPDKDAGTSATPPGKKKSEKESAENEAAKKKASIFRRTPETAEEKDKLLRDLYAHLATAESEEKATEISAAIERIWGVYGSDTVSLLLDRAMKSHAEKKASLTFKLFDHAIALAPDHTEVWSRRAFVFFQNNDVRRAVADLRRVIALDPNHFKALDGLTTVWREVGYKKGALAVVRRLLEIHPFAPGAKQALDELVRDVEGQGI